MWDRVRAARLLLACDYPFREILGVELSPELDRVARANIARYHGARHRAAGQLHAGGCGGVPWPPGPLIVYMWNAFTGPVMEQVFQNLEASLAQLPRELYLVYIHPELEVMLEGTPLAQHVVAGGDRDERRRLRAPGLFPTGMRCVRSTGALP